MNIQKKSLEHISDLLKSVDTYPVYSAIIKAMTDEGIDNETRTRISNKYQEAMSVETFKVGAAKDWVDTLIKDVDSKWEEFVLMRAV